MKVKEVAIDLATIRALVAMQPKGRAELARAAGIALPNLSRFLKSGQQTLLSKVLRDKLFKEMGLSASGWIRARCHIWRAENVEDVVKACQWVVPKGGRVSIRELCSENDRIDRSEALVQMYMLRWMVDARPRRVLLQLRASEQHAVDARQRLIECGLFAIENDDIPVVPLAPPDFEKLSEVGTLGSRAFDDLFDREAEITWNAVIAMLPQLFGSANAAFVALQTLVADREISKAVRRVRGKKSE